MGDKKLRYYICLIFFVFLLPHFSFVNASELLGTLSLQQLENSFELDPNDPNNYPITKPSEFDGTNEQAIGFFSNGSLINHDALEDEGTGFIKLFRSRNRQFATFDLIEIVYRISEKISFKFPNLDRLQIGDFSAPQGCDISGHTSHENGLDADFAYFRQNNREQDINNESGFDEVFVRNGALTANFDIERNFILIKYLVETNRINRIFVDPLIKSTFCEYAQNLGNANDLTETLRRMRPYPNHHDHLHVRITCPLNSPRCINQIEPPLGSGCDEVFTPAQL